MTDKDLFCPAQTQSQSPVPLKRRNCSQGFPWLCAVVLTLLLVCCLGAELLMTKDPSYLDLENCNVAPNLEFLFGTDTLGRDIFSGIWYGGRLSLSVGFLATLISTAIAVIYGALSGMAPEWADGLMMRFTEIFLSVPSLLIVLFLQAIMGQANVLTLSIVIGVTGWPGMAKVIRTEVRQLRVSGYVLAARSMGAGFWHILRKHMAPSFIASIMFMVVMNVRSAIVAESTLSFMGMGLPLETVSWGSMLSLAGSALTTGSWWIVVIPGAFLIVLLMCLTGIGNYLRKTANRRESRL